MQDIKFVIGKLLVETQLVGQIDPANIAVVGHSDGADTALSAGYSSQKDSRLKAVVAIAPDYTSGLGSGPPLLLMHSDSDTTVPYSESVALFPTIQASPKYFATLIGADHFESVVGNSPQTPAIDALTATFLSNQTGGPSSSIEDLVTNQFSQFVRLQK